MRGAGAGAGLLRLSQLEVYRDAFRVPRAARWRARSWTVAATTLLDVVYASFACGRGAGAGRLLLLVLP